MGEARWGQIRRANEEAILRQSIEPSSFAKKRHLPKGNPSRQATHNALRLKNFLQADKVNVFVKAAVVWANTEGALTVENPKVTVWRYSRLADELGNIWQREKISEVERNKIVEKLTKLCEQQKNKN